MSVTNVNSAEAAAQAANARQGEKSRGNNAADIFAALMQHLAANSSVAAATASSRSFIPERAAAPVQDAPKADPAQSDQRDTVDDNGARAATDALRDSKPADKQTAPSYADASDASGTDTVNEAVAGADKAQASAKDRKSSPDENVPGDKADTKGAQNGLPHNQHGQAKKAEHTPAQQASGDKQALPKGAEVVDEAAKAASRNGDAKVEVKISATKAADTTGASSNAQLAGKSGLEAQAQANSNAPKQTGIASGKTEGATVATGNADGSSSSQNGSSGQQNSSYQNLGSQAKGATPNVQQTGNAQQPVAAAAPVQQKFADAMAQAKSEGTAALSKSSALNKSTEPAQTSQPAGTGAVGTQVPASQAKASAAANQAARPNVPARMVTEQVAVNIQRAVGKGQDQINIHLRPKELGRIDVKIDMSHDGKMTAVITADKQHTLDLLKQDSRSLMQSLSDAGLQTDQGSLSFNLRSNNENNFAAGQGQGKGKGIGPKVAGTQAADMSDLPDAAAVKNSLGEDGRWDLQV